MNYMQYMSPEDAQKLAEMSNFDDQLDVMNSNTQLPERSNGRVVGVTSPLEGLGMMANKMSSAYMLNQSNKNRGAAAKRIAEALRGYQGFEKDPTVPTDANGNFQFD